MLTGPQVHGTGGGTAVRINGRGVDAVLQPRHKASPFRNEADADRLIADRIGAADGLCMIGRVGHLDFELHQGIALLQRLAHEVVRQFDRELGVAALVGLTFPGLELLELHVKRAGRHLDLGAAYRFAEEVVGLQISVHRLARQVETLVCRQFGLELAKHILLDGHGLVGLLRLSGRVAFAAAEDGPDVVIAHVHFIGKLEVERGDAEVRRPLRALEYLVPLGVFDFERQVRAGNRLEIKGAQRQGADVHELPGLIERLVGHQQDFGARLDLHRPLEFFLAQAGFGRHLQRVLPGSQLRHLEGDIGRAAAIGSRGRERNHLAVLRPQLHRNIRARKGNGLCGGLDAVDLAAEGRRAVGIKLLAARQRGLMGLDQKDLAQGHV